MLKKIYIVRHCEAQATFLLENSLFKKTLDSLDLILVD